MRGGQEKRKGGQRTAGEKFAADHGQTCSSTVAFKPIIGAHIMDPPGGSDSKASCLQCGRPGFDPWVGKILWRRKWQPTPVLLPGKSHGQRSMVGYSPRGYKESDTTERYI